jgi:hypothetical protein
VNITDYVAADLDFTYNHFAVNQTALARLGEPDGSVGLWSLTFNPVVKLTSSKSFARPYLTGGFGLYRLNLTLSQPTTVPAIVCDPFFGFCYTTAVGVNQVVFSNTTYKGGLNAGAGVDFRLGQHKASLFAEARYNRMCTTHGQDVTFAPVTFGIHF